MTFQKSSSDNPYQTWPKIDLHRHLEGSIRLDTMLDIVGTYGLDLPAERLALSRLVQVQQDDPASATSFLSKFTTIRKFFHSPEIITRITREAVEDAANDGVRYLEMRFTPVALSRVREFALADVIDWVCDAAAEAGARTGVMVRLIASSNRHEPVDFAVQVAKLAAKRVHRGIVGIDIAGNEEAFPLAPFLPAFQEAQKVGLALAIHAGEWAGAENVREAVADFGARRIGHGVRVLEDVAVADLARDLGVTFEVCVTSNCQTGVVAAPSEHPFGRMRGYGLRASLHTDDPELSQITLSGEYQLAVEALGLSDADLKQSILDAADGAFLPADERAKLVASLRSELAHK